MSIQTGCTEVPEHKTVGELRRWLSEFGEQSRLHYANNQVRPGTTATNRNRIHAFVLSTATTRSIPPTIKKSRYAFEPAATPIFRSFSPDVEQGVETNHELIATNDTSGFRVLRIEKLLPPVEDWAFDNKTSASWDDSFREADDFPTLLEDENWDGASIGTGSHTDPGIGGFTRKMVRRIKRHSKDDADTPEDKKRRPIRRTLPLLLCKSIKDGSVTTATPITLKNVMATSSGMPAKQDEHQLNTPLDRKQDPVTQMHTSNLFQEGAMTSATLQFLCSGKMDDVDIMNLNSISEEATASMGSEDSALPSISPGAIDIRLSEIFAEETDAWNRQGTLVRSKEAVLRHRLSSVGDYTPQHPFHRKPNEQKIQQAIQFGGTSKKTSVQRCKEELEKKWAEGKKTSHVKKVRWQACPGSGTYKKKVTLAFIPPE